MAAMHGKNKYRAPPKTLCGLNAESQYQGDALQAFPSLKT